MSLYKKAADQGYLNAIYNNCYVLAEGYVGEANKREPISLYKKASYQGYLSAICQYGYVLAEGYLGQEEKRETMS
jgi:TPR repeat protein